MIAIKKLKKPNTFDDKAFTDATDATDTKLETVESVQSEKQTTQQKEELEQEESLEFLGEFRPSTCTQKQRPTRKGGLSVVYAATGKRITLSQTILNHLPSNLDSVQIGIADDFLLIGKYLAESCTNYDLKSLKNGKTIYNSELVKEIVEEYNLDFSGHSSLTFEIHKVENFFGGNIVYIDMLNRF